MKTIIRKTPNTMYQPVGNYSHTTIIPAGMDTYVFSGQIGIRDDGSFPAAFNDEVLQLFKNIKVLLGTEGLSGADITKVNIWSVKEIDWDYFDNEWDKLFDRAYPSMTIAHVTALGLPEISIEIDIWAAKQPQV
ncbi:RidA family protein [Desulfovibrio desulfuricans]|uniref:RidA family protein n=1 Tax=Desulfovibrio desulfuricans TaxID=876 RepID=UPI0003B68E0F|nr:RidA family protein [Desulfovibrio desulfuricans]MDD3683769.1 RidA family protein [Desulfovibrio desulfuricans]QTO39098.1 RidA family protein [Desulfovibrio desulfuricans]